MIRSGRRQPAVDRSLRAPNDERYALARAWSDESGGSAWEKRLVMSEQGASEDQFLGVLLGLAIGDALGRPVRGLAAEEIADRHGAVTEYIRTDPDASGSPGEITDKTEICLCIVESLTTNDGLVDPVNINARMGFLTRGPSRVYMSEAVISGVERAEEHEGQVSDDRVDAPELAVAIRGVPVGLLHGLGAYDEATIRRETAILSRLTHAGMRQADLTAQVALAVCQASRGRLSSLHGNGDDLSAVITEIVALVHAAEHFEDAVVATIGGGGETDTGGALAGAIAGARFGASGIPQGLIDGLDARIYLSMAAPWFYRTALRRAGTVIDLRVVD